MHTIFYNLFSSFALVTACMNTLPKRVKPLPTLLLFTLNFIITQFSVVIIGRKYTLVTLLCVCVFIHWNQQQRILGYLCSMFGYAFHTVIHYSLLMVLRCIFHIKPRSLSGGSLILFLIIFTSITYIATRYLGYLLREKIRIQKIQIPQIFLLTLCMIFIICVAIFILNFWFSESLGFPPLMVTANAILFFTYFLVSTILLLLALRTKQKEFKAQQRLIEYEQLADYTKRLESIYTETRKFKHDYMNILVSLTSYIEDGEYEKLSTYFYTNILPTKQRFDPKTVSLGTLGNIHILELKSLLYVKFITALEQGLSIALDIPNPVETIDMDMIDFIRVIGILMDNAMESAMDSTNKNITLGILAEHDLTLITINNSCDTQPLLLSNLYEKNVSSKGVGRGIGLTNVREILGTYLNVLLNTEYNEGEFKQSIHITQGGE